MNRRLTSARGIPLQVGRELARGGEGAVLDLADHAELVAKIYHSLPDQNKADKLVAMVNRSSDRLRKVSAWPVDTVHESPSGLICGFVMRKVAEQKDIHVLYGPKTRLKDYPEAGYRFLVHVAANLARAFAVVHEHGHVVGDVNEGCVRVSRQGTVTLVDCDSFQIHASNRQFGCDVGIPIYQPPELQHVRSFKGLSRTPNHDAFGLAVLIFRTIFLARHPFAGTFQGKEEMPIERAIREYRFPYAADAARRQMRQPQASLGLGVVPPAVAALFERAFLEDGARGKRPAAAEWVAALDAFAGELRDCANNSGHAHAQALANCPLCEIERRGGIPLFIPHRQISGPSVSVDLEELWRELTAVIASARIPPVAAPPIPVLPVPDSVVKFKRTRSRSSLFMWAGIAASVLLVTLHPATLAGLIVFPVLARKIRGPVPAESRDLVPRRMAARERVYDLQGRIDHERVTSPLPQMERRAEELRRGLLGFPLRKAERLMHFERGLRAHQVRRYLDGFEVKDCGLKGFGPGLIAALVSNGIETADDITVENLQGLANFGPKRASALLEWRRELEAQFRFNPLDATNAQERAQVERDLCSEYAKEVAELQHLSKQVRGYASALRARLDTIDGELCSAQHDLAVLEATASFLRFSTSARS